MVIEPREKIHVVQRRAFEADVRRHFIGEVIAGGDTAVRARGYVFVFEKGKNQYMRLPEIRTRIVALNDAALIINLLPTDAKIEKAMYTTNAAMRLVVTDGENFSLEVNEFGISH